MWLHDLKAHELAPLPVRVAATIASAQRSPNTKTDLFKDEAVEPPAIDIITKSHSRMGNNNMRSICTI